MRERHCDGWTEERYQRAKSMWVQGLSATQIGKQLGVTRNSVLGKLYRMKVAGRAAPSIPDRARALAVAAEARAAKPRQPPKPRTDAPPRTPRIKVDYVALARTLDVTLARPWEERRLGQCAWPVEMEGAIWSCCAPVGHMEPQLQYCATHMQMRVQPANSSTTPSELIRSCRRYA